MDRSLTLYVDHHPARVSTAKLSLLPRRRSHTASNELPRPYAPPQVFDIRMMKAAAVMRGQKRDVTSVAWHPHHEELFVSGGADGSLLHWLVGYPQPQAEARGAHEGPVWSLEYHPMGHILCRRAQRMLQSDPQHLF